MGNIAKLRITQLAEQVHDTSRPPFSACCHLETRWDDGQQSVGSGIIFGSRTIITCAHNLFRREAGVGGGWFNSLRVTPGANGPLAPVGQFNIDRRHVDTHEQWQVGNDIEADVNDLGVIWLPAAIGDRTRWSDLTWMTDWDAKPGQKLVSCGYPPDKPAKTLWLQYGELRGWLNGLFFYSAPFGGGLSGAPIWLKANTPPFVNTVALHKGNGTYYDEPTSVGFRLTPEHYDLIQRWTRQTAAVLRPVLSRKSGAREAEPKPASVTASASRAKSGGDGPETGSKAKPARKRAAAPKPALNLTSGVEAVVKPGKTSSWKFPLKAGQTADFTFYAQATDPEAGLESCSLAVADQEGAELGHLQLFVNTSGDSFNKQTLSVDAEETGTHTVAVRSQADTELRVKLKAKFS